MNSATDRTGVTIRVFGSLRRYMDENSLPYVLERGVPGNGLRAYELATCLSLPPEKIEAVFCNGRVINIYDVVHRGDRVAFFPYGTPGPYRVFLGMTREGARRARLEKEGEREEGQ